jgi:uncharacterized LabA/DUF88 family protein
MKRTIFYFDGFNFYNGLKSKAEIEPTWKKFYWIDFVKFCEQFVNDDALVTVKYFTAPSPNDKQRSRQSALFSANKLLNPDKFLLINGIYQSKTVNCKKCKSDFQQHEEKKTDVNIALSMVIDCFLDNADTLVLISADSDQIPTIQEIKTKFPDKKIKIYFPPQRSSAEIQTIAKTVVFLDNNMDKFNNAVMAEKVELNNKIYTRPNTWK